MGIYDGINFTPPEGVANAAKRGLELRRKRKGKSKPGLSTAEASKQGIGSGVQRATNLSNRNKLSPETIRQMNRFFSRHEKNAAIDPEHRGKPEMDNGYVSWLLWGGDPGRSWANKVLGQMEAAEKKSQKRGDCVTLTRTDRMGSRLPAGARELLEPPQIRESDGAAIVQGFLFRSGVLHYPELGTSEYRSPEVVSDPDLLQALNGLQVLKGPDHPRPDPKGGFSRSDKRRQASGAVLGEGEPVEFGGETLVKNTMAIHEVSAQKSALLEGQDGLSLGYSIEGRREDGTAPDGTPYNFLVTKIIPDHVITTHSPRAGDSAALRIDSEGDIMPKIEINGEMMEPGAVQSLVSKLMDDIKRLKEGRKDGDYGEKEDMDKEKGMMSRGDADALKASLIAAETRADHYKMEVESLKAEMAQRADSKFDGKQVKDHIKAALKAKELLRGDSVSFDDLVEMDKEQMMVAVLKTRYDSATVEAWEGKGPIAIETAFGLLGDTPARAHVPARTDSKPPATRTSGAGILMYTGEEG